ncbi:MAG: T9SS type A sorting domain-containing protein, partial [Brumimicrobium sp.]
TITVYPPSTAGQGGTINVCLNEPINLFDGLGGNVDHGGTWYNPSDDPIAGSQQNASNIPGNYNYDYIVTNGVCPADTSLVEVQVDGGCDYLSLGEETLADLSVFPNPATDLINISNPTGTESLRVEMLDMNGRVVVSDANALSNTSEATIDIDHLQKGVYTLRIYNGEGQRTFKIVKQ